MIFSQWTVDLLRRLRSKKGQADSRSSRDIVADKETDCWHSVGGL